MGVATPAASGAPRATSANTREKIERSRKDSKGKLLAGARNGSLDAALSKERSAPPAQVAQPAASEERAKSKSSEELRKNARGKLLAGARDGSLNAALTKTKKN